MREIGRSIFADAVPGTRQEVAHLVRMLDDVGGDVDGRLFAVPSEPSGISPTDFLESSPI